MCCADGAVRNVVVAVLLLDVDMCLLLHAEFQRLGLIPGFKEHRVSLFLPIHFFFALIFPK